MDSRPETQAHIDLVRSLLYRVCDDLKRRAQEHDQSKLESPEVEVFDEFTPKLKDSTYGSPEYNEFLMAMQVGLDHHYAKNSHHPEHAGRYFECQGCGNQQPIDGVGHCVLCGSFNLKKKANMLGMNILDLVECLVDWAAACQRHHDGSLTRSIHHNQKRFGYSDDLKQILLNSVPFFFPPAVEKTGVVESTP